MSATIFRKMKSSTDESAGESSPPRAIVAGHGDFPFGIVSAVEQISGRGGVLLPVSNKGLSGADIETQLKAAAEQDGIQVFFTDLPGGSATLAVRRIMRERPDVVLVTGTNLATLLEFVFQSTGDCGAAARISVEKGRNALAAFGPL
jgi:PTS system N-acetylgalactosamine-specific IIA component